LLGAAKNLVDIVFIALLDVVRVPEYSRWVQGHSVFAGSIGFEQRDMEDVVYLPFPWEREGSGERRDEFFDLEGTMIFVVHLPRGATRLDVATVEHNQVPNLVCGGLLSLGVCVPAHSLLCRLETLSGLVVYGVHPVRVDLASGVENIDRRRVRGIGVESVIGVERRQARTGGNRVVVGELGHG